MNNWFFIMQQKKRTQERARKAYRIRLEKRLPWWRVAEIIDEGDPDLSQYTKMNRGARLRRHVKLYAEINDLLWPLPRHMGVSEAAYIARVAGDTWRQIANDQGLNVGDYARRNALRYATKYKQPWPIGGKK